jgi:hypothetical protein
MAGGNRPAKLSSGAFRLPIRPVSTLRLSGVGMLIAGVAMIKLL